MNKQVLINSLALCISNLELVNRDITDSPQHDLISSTTEMLSLMVSLMDNITIEN